jgi:acyl-CoA synthetase (AMP-forming)/AMP-acid ligase II
MRLRGMARFADFLGDVKAGDRVYNVLPLYHMTGGALGMAGPLIFGATIVLKRKLSVSEFWDDVADYGATKFVYIGELCRYLLAAPPHPRERGHKLAIGFGQRAARRCLGTVCRAFRRWRDARILRVDPRAMSRSSTLMEQWARSGGCRLTWKTASG